MTEKQDTKGTKKRTKTNKENNTQCMDFRTSHYAFGNSYFSYIEDVCVYCVWCVCICLCVYAYVRACVCVGIGNVRAIEITREARVINTREREGGRGREVEHAGLDVDFGFGCVVLRRRYCFAH